MPREGAPSLTEIKEKRDRTSERRKQVLNYHRDYNEKHSDELAEKKKQKYDTDPAYREAAKKRANSSYQRKKRLEQEVRKMIGPQNPARPIRSDANMYCPTCLQPIPRAPKPIYKSVGKKYAVAMYTIKEVARRLGKQVRTMQLWIRQGFLPDTFYKDRRTKEGTTKAIMTRLWTQDQIEMLMRVVNRYDLRPPVSFEKIGLLAELRREWDKLRPLGIDVSLYTVPTEHGDLLARPSADLPTPGYAQPKAEHTDGD
jgi:hypothetical protein